MCQKPYCDPKLIFNVSVGAHPFCSRKGSRQFLDTQNKTSEVQCLNWAKKEKMGTGESLE